MPEENGKRQSQSPGFLASVLGSSAIITGWAFVLGWTYLHTYYQYFGININALGFPVYHYLVFFFAQTVSFHLQGLILGLMTLAVLLTSWFGNTVQRWQWAVAICLILSALFLGGFRIAERDATYAALQDMGPNTSRPIITLEFKEPPHFQYGAVEDAVGSANLRLLLENEDRIFLFEPLKTYDPPIFVDVIAMDTKDLIVSKRTVRIQ